MGLAKVMSVEWERKQSSGMGPENERKGVQEHCEETEAPRTIRVVTRPREPGLLGWGFGEGGKSIPVYFKRTAKGLASNQR